MMHVLSLICAAWLALGVGLPAHAQTTKSILQTTLTTQFPDNTVGAITPSIFRTWASSVVNSFQQYAGVNPQTGTTYTLQLSDYGQIVTASNASPIAWTLPQATGSFSTWNAYVKNVGTGTLVITPTTSTIDGNAILALAAGQSAWIVASAGNYITWVNGSTVVNCGALPAFTGDATKPAASCVMTNVNLPAGITMAGNLIATNIISPGTPSAGRTGLWADLTDKRFHDINDAGTIGTTVVASGAVSNQFLTAVSAAGLISRAQPSAANLSNGTTGSGAVVLANAPAFTGAFTSPGATLAGQLIVSYASPNFSLLDTGTSFSFFQIQNAGGTNQMRVGTESAAGGSLFSGSSALASVIGSTAATPLEMFASNTLRAKIFSSGAFSIGSTPVDNGANTLYVQGVSRFASNISPNASDGAALGTTALQWSDLFLASGGVINWSNGNFTATQSAGLLTFAGGNVDLSQGYRSSTQSTPAQIVANTDNYNPSSVICASSGTLLINSDAARNLTGLAGGTAGCEIVLQNNGAFTITLKDQTTSTAANQFKFGADFSLTANASIKLFYDGNASRWRNLSSTVSPTAGVTSITCGPNSAGGTGPITTSGDCANGTLLETLTLTGASVATTVAWTGYNRIQIVISDAVPATNSVDLYFRVCTTGPACAGGVQSTSYLNAGYAVTGGGSAGAINGTAAVLLSAGTQTSFAAANGLSGSIVIDNPNGSTSPRKIYGNTVYKSSAGTLVSNMIGGYWDSTTATPGGQLIPSTGNWSSGTAKIYGSK